MADEPQPRDAVLDAEQLDVAAVGLQVRAHLVERLAHPRLEVDRVEAVDEQQARDDAVLDQPLADRRPAAPASSSAVEDALQPLAVELR